MVVLSSKYGLQKRFINDIINGLWDLCFWACEKIDKNHDLTIACVVRRGYGLCAGNSKCTQDWKKMSDCRESLPKISGTKDLV